MDGSAMHAKIAMRPISAPSLKMSKCGPFVAGDLQSYI
jgi:hypothetical protein